MGIAHPLHSYLSYLRDRLLLARELLHESGSCFVQISDENIHHVKELLDEIFSPKNFCGIITYRTTGGQSTSLLSASVDYLIWFAKEKELARTKFRQLTRPKVPGELGATQYTFIEPRDSSHDPRPMDDEEFGDIDGLLHKYRVLAHDTLYSQGAPSDPADLVFEWRGEKYRCPPNTHWKPGVKSGGMKKLADANRLMLVGNTLRYKRYIDDNPVSEIDNVWNDTAISGFGRKKRYVVETNLKVIERCILLTTDPGDLVFDPTCGSGTTAYGAEKWGRRWITCDTSRVALALAKERLMTARFPYFQLAHPEEGVDSGFTYETVPHIQLGSIANVPDNLAGLDEERLALLLKKYADQRPLYDHPNEEKTKARVTGPFTVEAVPAPAVKPIQDAEEQDASFADESIARTGETQRQGDWRDELLKSGIRGKGGQRIAFTRVEPLPATRWLHAEAETREDKPQRVMVSFGPEYAPLEQRQVELALGEAETLRPKPKILVFAAFQFDPEADIDETSWPGVTLLKAQMNADLLTEDLKKKRSSNEGFWLIGQPDVDIEKVVKGPDKGKYQVTVNGFDYYNTQTGVIESGGADKIAMWMLDTDYDGRSLFPRQVFFPMAGERDGWTKLAKSLRAEIDEGRIKAYRGTVSLPFDIGEHKRAAVKIIDTRGVESLRLVGLE
jgi:adenine-specific DNA-methyltransferase